MLGIVTRGGAERPASDHRVIINLLIFILINNMPRFLAAQAEAIAGAGSGQLMTTHSQTYPQFLGISVSRVDLWGLPTNEGRGRMAGYRTSEDS